MPDPETSRGPRNDREDIVHDLGRLYRLRRDVASPPAGAERRFDGHPLAVPHYYGLCLLSRFGALEDEHEVADVADLLAGELHQQVSPLDAGGLGRASSPNA